MNYEEFKKRVCEIEEAIRAKGYRPGPMWHLLRVLKGDLRPPGATEQTERWWHSRRERRYLIVRPLAPPPHAAYQKRRTYRYGSCAECGAPLTATAVCPDCGFDNYWNMVFGLTTKNKDNDE